MLDIEVTDRDQPPPFGLSTRKELFLLDSETTFANHGSFGTVARKVLEVQHRLQDLQEKDPDKWFRVTAFPLYLDACKTVAEFVGTSADNVVLVDNATTAVNSVLKSLDFNKGDAILVTDHTYQPVDYTASTVTLATEARVVRHAIPFPINSVDQFITSFEATLSANTDIRLAIIDHISSQSALLFPVKQLTDICHSRNIQVLVDGAHAPGQVVIDLDYLAPDYYTGNLHKWVYAPRGCCLLYINHRHHDKIHPLVTSWYWKKGLQERFFMQATRDILSWLCAKPSIQFYCWLGGLEKVTSYTRSLSYSASAMLATKWGTMEQKIPAEMRAPNMAVIALPPDIGYEKTGVAADQLTKDLARWYKVWVAISCYSGQLWCRISCQVYNEREDYDRVAEAVLDLCKKQ